METLTAPKGRCAATPAARRSCRGSALGGVALGEFLAHDFADVVVTGSGDRTIMWKTPKQIRSIGVVPVNGEATLTSPSCVGADFDPHLSLLALAEPRHADLITRGVHD